LGTGYDRADVIPKGPHGSTPDSTPDWQAVVIAALVCKLRANDSEFSANRFQQRTYQSKRSCLGKTGAT